MQPEIVKQVHMKRNLVILKENNENELSPPQKKQTKKQKQKTKKKQGKLFGEILCFFLLHWEKINITVNI